MFNTTTPKGAYELMQNGATYIDVRTAAEFLAGHPKGAVNIPAFFKGMLGMSPNPNFVSEVEKRFSKDHALVIGCATGGRSARACELLAHAGYTTLTNCDGSFMGKPGIPGWKDEGLPVE